MMEGRISNVLPSQKFSPIHEMTSPTHDRSSARSSPSSPTYGIGKSLDAMFTNVNVAAKQVESPEPKNGELSHLQLNLIREQLTKLTREMSNVRHDTEGLRTIVRDVQGDLEKESYSRRKDGEEFLGAYAQLKQILEQERADRSQALQAMEKDVAEQLTQVKSHHRESVEAIANTSAHFENACMELRAVLEAESAAFGQKLQKLQQEVIPLAESLEKEIRERIETTMKIADGKAIRADLEKATRNIPSLEKEVALRKTEAEELVRTERTERQAMGEQLRKGFEEKISVLAGDQGATDARYADLAGLIGQAAKHVDVESHLKRFAQKFNELVDSLEATNKETRGQHLELLALKRDMDKFPDGFRAADAQVKNWLDDLARNFGDDLERERLRNGEQHQANAQRYEQLERRLRDMAVEMQLVRLKVDDTDQA